MPFPTRPTVRHGVPSGNPDRVGLRSGRGPPTLGVRPIASRIREGDDKRRTSGNPPHGPFVDQVARTQERSGDRAPRSRILNGGRGGRRTDPRRGAGAERSAQIPLEAVFCPPQRTDPSARGDDSTRRVLSAVGARRRRLSPATHTPPGARSRRNTRPARRARERTTKEDDPPPEKRSAVGRKQSEPRTTTQTGPSRPGAPYSPAPAALSGFWLAPFSGFWLAAFSAALRSRTASANRSPRWL